MTAAFLVCIGGSVHMNCAAEEAAPLSGAKKILVAYFSHTGNTRQIAEHIHAIAGGDLFEIQAVDPYPADYHAVLEKARQELESRYKPALKTTIENIGSYDVLFVGYPIWFGTYPAPVKTFLSEYDLSGKTIVPFSTHGGGGPGRSASDVSKLCPRSTVLEGFSIPGNSAKTARDTVAEWLKKIRMT